MQGAQVLWFEGLGRGDVGRVGGKNASLGEMVSGLAAAGVRVPPGFATTAEAYWGFLDANDLRPTIGRALDVYEKVNRDIPFKGLITTLLLLPMMMSAAVVGLFWKLLYDPSWGVINYALGLGDLAWLSDPNMALYAIAITDIWMWAPFVMLLSLAGSLGLIGAGVFRGRGRDA